jgi:hypothetical protein
MSPLATLLLGLALLGIKHFLADFVLQFPYMVRDKGIYGAEGGIHHAMLHASFTFLILVFLANNANDIILLSLLDGVLHYHIDWAKQQLNKGLTPADRMFWAWIGLDQALHYLTYLGILSLLVL